MSATDMLTKRPRTPNDLYTNMTDEQIRNIRKDPSAFFFTQTERRLGPGTGAREPNRSRSRYTNSTSQHLIRGEPISQQFGWIDSKWDRFAPDNYNSSRLGAYLHWGPEKAGMRTYQHYFDQPAWRYANIEMYTRPPTNQQGQVFMAYGRPTNDYYAQRNPNNTSWYGTSARLNRTSVLENIHPKTYAEYAMLKRDKQNDAKLRSGEWPEYSEYTDRYLLNAKVARKLTGIAEKKQHIAQLQTS